MSGEKKPINRSMLLKMTILGMALMFYGGVNHLRKNETSRAKIMKHLSPANQEKFMAFLVPKPGKGTINMEKAKSDLKKIRSFDEECLNGGGTNCRMADTPQLENSVSLGSNLDEKSALGKAFNQMKHIEKAKFDEFKKLDEL